MKEVKKHPFVSICITTYNVASYISKAIEGILMQKVSFPFEIIIGDDTSTDDTLQVCRHYQNQYPDIIRLVLHDKNVGVNKNNYDVIKQAKGKYIAWCDGDDYWIDENKLQRQFDILEANDDVALVHTDWLDFTEATGEKREVRITQNEIEKTKYGKACIEMLLLQQDTGCRFSSVMFRSAYYLDSVEKDPLLHSVARNSSDVSIFVAMYERGRFFHLPEVTTVYRIRKESLSMTQSSEKRFRYLNEYLKLVVHIMGQYAVSERTKEKVLKRVLSGLLLYTFYKKKRIDAINIKVLVKDVDYTFRFAERVLFLGTINPFFCCIIKPLIFVYRKLIIN